jgi:teichuronic acid exporter
MNDSLRHKTIRALLWSFLEFLLTRSTQLIVGILLARLLLPEQFGLIGILTVFIAIMQAFIDGGFGAALIQKRDVTHADLCSIFYFNIAIGLVVAAWMWAAAPWITDFYRQPILTPMMRALSLTIVLNSLGMIQSSILTKEINFKLQAKVSWIASGLSGIIGVSLAAMHFEVWSLVFQQISAALFRTMCLWRISSWRPAFIFSFNSLSEMFSFGSRMLFSRLLNQFFDNIYSLVIGKLFSATDLGYFLRARDLREIPSQTLLEVVGRVSFPVFSSIQDDPARLRKAMKKAMTASVMVNFPMMIGLAAIARPLVIVLLTPKWADCVPYLQLLCLVRLLYPLHLINLNVLQAMGRSDLFFRLEIIKKILVATNLAISWQWGITAIIFGMFVLEIIGYYLNSYYAGQLIGYPSSEQLRDVVSYLIMSILMGICLFSANFLPFPNDWTILLFQIALGISAYIALCRKFRLPAFMDIWEAGWKNIRYFMAEVF